MSRTVSVIVVDDSLVFRMTVRQVLSTIPDVEVIESAADGKAALDLVQQHAPDLLTLDVQMPGIDGLEVLRRLKKRGCRTKAIMLSNFTSTGTDTTTEALLEGAFDFIPKPRGSDASENLSELRFALTQKISAYRESLDQPKAPTPTQADFSIARPDSFQLIVFGASTGGPEALRTLLPNFSASLEVPVIVVQHMPAGFTASLSSRLSNLCSLPVLEAQDGAELCERQISVLPGGIHTRLVARTGHLFFRTKDDLTTFACRPSIDYLLCSIPPELAINTLAVILTGMGQDGTEGCRYIKRHGGTVVAQDQESSIVYGMPRSVCEAGLADSLTSLDSLTGFLNRLSTR